LKFQLGDMVLDMIMVFSSSKLLMDTRLRFQITGSTKEIHGKLKEEISLTILDSMENQTNIRTVVLRDQIGKDVKKLSPWPTIHQFQDLTLITQITFVYGALNQEILLISKSLIAVIIMEPFRKDRMLNISLLYYIQMTRLMLEKS
jgi:glutaredoxin-related protein